MSSQIFKKKIHSELFFNFLKKNSLNNSDKYTIFNNDSYKKGLLNNSIPEFIELCKDYYHISKHMYLERKLTYNSFTTILRQICNFNKIVYTSQIKYDKSSYNIVYYIYFND
jgi:hypothetical protein